MAALTRTNIKQIEEYWFNINEYKKQLQFREWELLNRNETDTNIGGGKSNVVSDPTARKAFLLAEDARYQYLKKIIVTIEQLYQELDDDQKTIVNMKYWANENDCYEWSHVGDELYMSVQRVLRKRNAFLNETARRLGML